MPFEIRLEYEIKANNEFIFDWWTDLSPGDTSLARPLKSRTILTKSEKQILLRDEEVIFFRKMSFNVKVSLNRPDSWVAEYDGKIASARSEYRLLSKEGSVTKLYYHSLVKPKGFLMNLFSPIVRILVKRVFKEEMDGFKKSLEADYRKRSKKTLTD